MSREPEVKRDSSQPVHANAEHAIAIVGIGCRFPGGIIDAQSFSRVLANGEHVVTETPSSRYSLADFFAEQPATPGHVMTRWGGYLDHIDEFDAAFFRMSPREAERLDPAQRLLLEGVWEAFEDAGIDTKTLEGSATGVFVGQWLSDFENRLFRDPRNVDFHMTTGSGRYATSGRISYAFGLNGPSLTIDTACSSSLAAVHLACQSLASGETDMAIAGGVNVILEPHISIAYSQSRMMAADGKCKFGDARADGYVRSEGMGVVVLKPLHKAIADGDRIYACIEGSAVNNDGSGSGHLATPSEKGQAALLRTAYRRANVDPALVQYVEAHGTGTRAGDPVEIGAIASVIGESRARENVCLLGSVKTNIGHTEGAAGIAGLIKTALALHHEQIPASLHVEEPSPNIPWNAIPFAVARTAVDWPVRSNKRVAGVSAFGIAGTNAHVVLSDAQLWNVPQVAETASNLDTTETATVVLPLSAQHPNALRALAAKYVDLLESQIGVSITQLSSNAANRRSHLEYRAAFVADSRLALIEKLRAFATGDVNAADAIGQVTSDKYRRIAFVFPGQGSQWIGMARDLWRDEPVFRGVLDQCERALRSLVDWSLAEQLHAEQDAPAYRLDDIAVVQPTLLAIEIAIAELWKSWGIVPDAVIGHSMGEVGAAHMSGVLSLDDAMRVIVKRSALMRTVRGQGAMASVELSFESAQQRVQRWNGQLSVAANNSEKSSVVSGDVQAIDQLLAELEGEGTFARKIKVDVASHSAQMDTLAPELERALIELRVNEPVVPMYSTVTGVHSTTERFDAHYWGRNLREPVMFANAANALMQDGIDAFVEVSPHPLMMQAIRQLAEARSVDAVVVPSVRRNEGGLATMLASLGNLYANGTLVDWACIYPAPVTVVDLPKYPWQRERYWLSSADANDSTIRHQTTRPVLDERMKEWVRIPKWHALEARNLTNATVRAGRWIVVVDHATSDAVTDVVRALELELASRGQAVTVTKASDLGHFMRDADNFANGVGVVVFAPVGGDAPFSPIAAVQAALVDHDARNRTQLFVVTCGAVAVDGHVRAISDTYQGATWGATRVIAEEYPDKFGGLIDLDPDQDVASSAAQLCKRILIGDPENQVAFRDGAEFALRLSDELDETREPVRSAWRGDGAYLITGGLGAVGLRIADSMVKNGARRLILLGRTPLPPRSDWTRDNIQVEVRKKIAAIRSMELAGASVHVLSADASNEFELRESLDAYAREGWPPILGVIHAAGVVNGAFVAKADRTVFNNVVASKLKSAILLDQLFPDVDVFVLFSSIVGTLGLPGTASYAAANAGLDALSYARHARGSRAISIQWGGWQDTGFHATPAGRHAMTEASRIGITDFTADSGTQIFEWIVGRSEAVLSVMPLDRSAMSAARGNRMARLFVWNKPGQVEAGNTSSHLSAMKGMTTIERRKELSQLVKQMLAKILRQPSSSIDGARTFGAMGVDSLMSIELRNRLESMLERPLAVSIVWNYPSVNALVEHVEHAVFQSNNTRSSNEVSDHARTATSDIATIRDHVAALSDEDALRSLLGAQ